MKVYKEGKEIKNAKVIYTVGGTPSLVEVDGTYYDARAYELKEEKADKKTKPADTKKKNSSVMTTEDV